MAHLAANNSDRHPEQSSRSESDKIQGPRGAQRTNRRAKRGKGKSEGSKSQQQDRLSQDIKVNATVSTTTAGEAGQGSPPQRVKPVMHAPLRARDRWPNPKRLAKSASAVVAAATALTVLSGCQLAPPLENVMFDSIPHQGLERLELSAEFPQTYLHCDWWSAPCSAPAALLTPYSLLSGGSVFWVSGCREPAWCSVQTSACLEMHDACLGVGPSDSSAIPWYGNLVTCKCETGRLKQGELERRGNGASFTLTAGAVPTAPTAADAISAGFPSRLELVRPSETTVCIRTVEQDNRRTDKLLDEPTTAKGFRVVEVPRPAANGNGASSGAGRERTGAENNGANNGAGLVRDVAKVP